MFYLAWSSTSTSKVNSKVDFVQLLNLSYCHNTVLFHYSFTTLGISLKAIIFSLIEGLVRYIFV
jgi:hypothetical protein